MSKTQIIETLVDRVNELLQRPYEPNVFTGHTEAGDKEAARKLRELENTQLYYYEDDQ